MRLLRLVPDRPNIDFIGKRKIAYAVSILLLLVTLGSLAVQGLNLGIDFAGGILIEAKSDHDIDIAAMRQQLNTANLGAVALQEFGGPRDILIRVQQQEGDAANQAAIQTVRGILGGGWEYRRVELVGPTVGAELLRDGIIATVLAVLAITAYVAFRFEWQFGVAALITTAHDVVVTLGLYTLFGLEFNLTSVAALLTLAGYSINDTVVVFDRIREMMRRYKQLDLKSVINEAVNQTLSRTVLTSGSTLLAILPLLLFGGSALFDFTLALAFGILLGTFSSVYVGAALLLHMPAIRGRAAGTDTAEEAAPRG
ncbi:protein translocase subunit SecF [Azospirillum halopraeferens]|uniref:protein translocase subunit SecF n=1 Tax=Azospirillum halopraeferens TaxID=34010 RepID=UPI000402A548|nr:protein translocase subunit SecF [Azospirillum halopraeferens]